MRRRLSGQVAITRGDDLRLSAADLSETLPGARWRKLIGSGHAVVAATERAGQRSVIFAEVSAEPAALKRIRVFSEARRRLAPGRETVRAPWTPITT